MQLSFTRAKNYEPTQDENVFSQRIDLNFNITKLDKSLCNLVQNEKMLVKSMVDSINKKEYSRVMMLRTEILFIRMWIRKLTSAKILLLQSDKFNSKKSIYSNWKVIL